MQGARRLLVVSYFFPPLGGVGVQRTLKYGIHLPAAGWQPVVVTPRDAAYWVQDPESVARLPPELEIHRSFCYEPTRLRRAMGRLLRAAIAGSTGIAGAVSGTGAASEAGGATGTETVAATNSGAGEGASRSGPLRVAGELWSRAVRFVFYPDEQITWVPFALRSGLKVHRANPVDAIYSSSPPVSTHLIAAALKAQTGLPWVADFRDPWIGNVFAAPPHAHQRVLQRRLERMIVSRADRVVFATPSLMARYSTRYRSDRARFVTIPNGYDPADLTVEPAPRDGPTRFRLYYGGSLYGERELAIFLEGVERLVSRRPELRDRLEIEFAGWLDQRNQEVAAAYLRPDRLGAVVRLVGLLPRQQALARLKAADAGLLLLADGPGRELFVGGKLFEYLGLDKQVLAMVPQGDARAILTELKWGVIADPDPDSVAAAVERLLSEPAPDGPADPEGRYDRRRLAARLAEVLDDIAVRSY